MGIRKQILCFGSLGANVEREDTGGSGLDGCDESKYLIAIDQTEKCIFKTAFNIADQRDRDRK